MKIPMHLTLMTKVNNVDIQLLVYKVIDKLTSCMLGTIIRGDQLILTKSQSPSIWPSQPISTLGYHTIENL